MGKRLLALFLCLVLCVGLLPAAAFAQEDYADPEEDEVTVIDGEEASAEEPAAEEQETEDDPAEEEPETGSEEENIPETSEPGADPDDSIDNSIEEPDAPSEEAEVYVSSDQGVQVEVFAPAEALPEGTELSVTVYDEDSAEYAAVAEAVGLTEDQGMIAMDISLLLDGEEVEPSEAVTVAIDASALLPDDACDVEVTHLEESGTSLNPVVVADVDDAAEGAVATFSVTGFSQFSITWSQTSSGSGFPGSGSTTTTIRATVYVYDTDGNEIEVDIQTLAGDSTVDLSALLNDYLDGDHYTYSYAELYYSTVSVSSSGSGSTPGGGGSSSTVTTTKYGPVQVSSISVSNITTVSTGGMSEGIATCTLGYTTSGGTASASNVSEINIYLYYDNAAPHVAAGSVVTNDDNTVTLTAELVNFFGESGSAPAKYGDDYVISWDWTVNGGSTAAAVAEDSDNAKNGSSDSATLTWAEGSEDGAVVSVTATASVTYTDSSGNTVTETLGSCTFSNIAKDWEVYTITVTYGSSSAAAAGAYVAIHDEHGNIVSSGTTDENGQLAVNLVPGTYHVDIEYTSGSTVYGLDDWDSSADYWNSDATFTVHSAGEVEDGADNGTTFHLTDTYSVYDHIDIEVGGTYSFTIGGVSYELESYIDPDYAMTIVLPDGETMTAYGSSQSSQSGGTSGGMEYHFPGSFSGQWDGDQVTAGSTDTWLLGEFQISGYVLISVSEVQNECGDLSESEIAAYFGTNIIYVSGHSSDAGIADGYYYLIHYSDYIPTVNVCIGSVSNNARGYDFEINLEDALEYLTEQLIVNKYVVDRYGNVVEDNGTEFSFTLEAADGSYRATGSAQSGGYYLFSDLSAGTYTITETEEAGYVPVTWDEDADTWTMSAYIQDSQTEEKEEDGIASVTFYNLQVPEGAGELTISKTVNVEEGLEGNYASASYTVNLYREVTEGKETSYVLVSDIGTKGNADIVLTDGSSVSFILDSGTYYLVEDMSNAAEEGVTWTVSVLGATMTTITVNGESVEAFEITVDENGAAAAIINNFSTEQGTVDVAGTKTWNDDNNRDGIRPGSVTVSLLADGEPALDEEGSPITAVVTAGTGWSYSFTDLPMTSDNGSEIVYTVTEDEVEGYTSSVDGYNITNTHTPEKINEDDGDPDTDGVLTVTKTWNDGGDQDGKRPGSITVTLYANGTAVDSMEITAADGWTGSFKDLYKYDNGVEIVYTISESAVNGYVSEVNGTEITNTLLLNGDGELTIKKVWQDNDNVLGLRPDEITVTLYENGAATEETLTLSDKNGWSGSFEGLEAYDENGDPISYTVEEGAITLTNGDTYEVTCTEMVDGTITVTNTLTGTWDNVTIKKVWEDDENHDHIRPDSVTIGLYADGEKVTDESGDPVEVTLSDDDKTDDKTRTWAGSFGSLPKYDEDGKLIDYTVTEPEVPEDYMSTVTGSAAAGFTVTNTHEDYVAYITVTKIWDDGEWSDVYRPDSVTVHLYADGEELDEETEPALVLTEANAVEGNPNVWTGTFPNSVYVYEVTDEGTVEVQYTVNEDDVAAYETTKNGTVILTQDETGWSGSVTIENTLQIIDEEPGEEPEPGGGDEGIVGPVTITKTWVDEKETHEDIEVTIFSSSWKDAYGEPVISKTVTLGEDNGWTAVIEGLPKYEKDGTTRIVYEIAEIDVTGYKTSIGTLAAGDDGTYAAEIVNTQLINTDDNDPDPTDDGILTVTKVWSDKGDQDGIRPDSVTVALYGNGEPTGDEIVLDDSNGWTGSFEGLPAYQLVDGKVVAIDYTVKETDTPDGYTASVGVGEGGLTVTNTHIPALINNEDEDPENDGVLTVTKVWNDDNNRDGRRPGSVTINLLADGQQIDSMVLTAEGGWTGSFTGLEKYRDGGVEIVYTVTEDAEENYTTVYNTQVDGYQVINTYDPEMTTVTITKAWDDADDQDGLRPDSVDITLEGSDGGSWDLTLGEWNGWTATVDVPVYYNTGALVEYTVTEAQADGYELPVVETENGYNFIVTNTHEPILVNTGDSDPENDGKISVEKIWNDAEDQDGLRPDSITVVLTGTTGEGRPQVVYRETVTLNGENGWTCTFENLPMYSHGEEIVYTLNEIAVTGYTSEMEGSVAEGYTITNTQLTNTGYDPADPDNPDPDPNPRFDDDPGNDGVVSVQKVWNDGDNADGLRPDSITVTLYADGEEIDSLVLTEDNGWSGSFTGLPKYTDEGEAIIYTVSEAGMTGYKAEITGSGAYGYTITNTQLTNTGYDPTDPDDPNPDPNPRFDDDPDNDGTITVEKVWKDGNNADNLRPESITVTLYADGKSTGDTLELNAANGWSGSFTDLVKYGDDGGVIIYTVSEANVEGYKSEVTGTNADGYIITNTQMTNTGIDPTDPDPNPSPDPDPENDGTITVEKVWVDGNNADDLRPDSVTVALYADGTASGDTLELNAANGWTGSFTDLVKYNDNGSAIIYSVSEIAVDGYKSEVAGSNADGYTITNTQLTNTGVDPADPDPSPSPDPDPENDGTITVEKVWNDGNNENGVRPDTVTVVLTANGEAADSLVLSGENGWTGSFTDLPKYSGDGSVIVYGISEVSAAGYSSELTGSNGGGYTVTNTLLVNGGGEVLADDGLVTVSKVWKDGDDGEGLRPEEITVTLYADGEDLGSMTLTADSGWTGSFKDLPAYGADGEEIIYTVEETAIVLDSEDAYVASYEYDVPGSVVITNTLTGVWGEEPEASGEPSNPDNPGASGTTGVTVEKIWQDNDDQDGLRPAEIAVTLFADGEDTGLTVTLSEGTGWTGSFGTLNKYDAEGNMIDYAVAEDNVPEGYISTAGGSAELGFTVTNIHDPALVNGDGVLSVTKAWDDNNDALGVRPEEVVLQLTANGEPVENMTLTLTAADNWTGSFTGLPAYANGEEIRYAVTETDSSQYYAAVGVDTVTEEDGTYSLLITNRIEQTFFPIDEGIVADENDPDSLVSDESVNEYEMVEIEMSTYLPVVSPEELADGEYTMTFHDVLDSALNLDETDADFTVYIAGVQVDHQYYTVVLDTDDDCSFHVTVDLTALYNDGVITEEDLRGDTEISVFFYADLEGTGLNGSYTSTVWYDVYNGDELLYTSNESVVVVYTFDIHITKYDASVLVGENYAGAALEGATLGVYYDSDCTDAVVRSGEDFTAVSDENGLALFAGLAEGTYYVKEIQAPDGYELSDEVLEVTLSTELEDHVSENIFANTPVETPAEPEAPAETTEPEEPAAPAEPEQTAEPEASEEPADETPAESDETASEEPVTEGTSGGSGTASGESSSPQTGDTSSLLFFAVMILVCGAAMICLVVVRRKRTDR